MQFLSIYTSLIGIRIKQQQSISRGHEEVFKYIKGAEVAD